MRQLLPDLRELDPYDAYRSRDPAQPLARLNMVVSADGAATDAHGRSGGLGGDGDLAVFRALRALADGILVGAGTARAEAYRPHRLRAELAARRAADDRPRPAAIVVVSGSLDLDVDGALFRDAVTPTIVLTHAASDPARRDAITAAGGEVLIVGDQEVDLVGGFAALRERGLAHLLCEGGPGLNAALLDAGLVDEVCLTLAPRLVGGDGPGMVTGLGAGRDLELITVGGHGDELHLRYRVTSSNSSTT